MDAILQGPKGYFVIFDYSVAFLAIIANCCILAAVTHSTFRLSGYRRFLISLTASDLYVCCVNVLTLLFQIFSSNSGGDSLSGALIDHPYFNCSANVLRTLQLAGFFTNLLNLCGMSLDHFIGVVYPLEYRYYMERNGARLAVISIWIISFALAFLDIPINVILYRYVADSQNYAGPASDQGVDNNSEYLPASPAQQNGLFPTRSPYKLSVHDNQERGMALFLNSGPSLPLPFMPNNYSSFYPHPQYYYDPGDEASSSRVATSTPTSVTDTALLFINNNTTPLGVNRTGSKNAMELLSNIFRILEEEEEALRNNQTADVCTFYHETKMWFEICTIVLAIVCSVVLTLSYGVIVKKVSDSGDVSGRRMTRKTIFTTAMLLSAFMICWMPFITFELIMFIMFQRGNNYFGEDDRETVLVKSLLIQQILNSLLRTYPLIDPLIYAARIPAVQQQCLIWCIKHFPACSRCCLRYLKTKSRNSFVSTKMTSPQQIGIPASQHGAASNSNTNFDFACNNPETTAETAFMQNNQRVTLNVSRHQQTSEAQAERGRARSVGAYSSNKSSTSNNNVSISENCVEMEGLMASLNNDDNNNQAGITFSITNRHRISDK